MIRQSINKYIILGKVIRLLTLAPDQTSKDHFIRNIQHLYQYCIDSGFKVSKGKIENEFNIITGEINGLEEGSILSEEQIRYIQEAMIRCEEIFDIEAGTKDVYELYNPKLEIEKLIDDPLSIINQAEKLNNIAREDFENGSKALAYGLRTAFVFHFMRVLENLTRIYAKHFGVKVGNKDTMGKVLRKLSDPNNIVKNKRKYNDKITKELDHIRDQYRNPTQHPDATYSQQDAESLYHRCLSIINGILGKI